MELVELSHMVISENHWATFFSVKDHGAPLKLERFQINKAGERFRCHTLVIPRFPKSVLPGSKLVLERFLLPSRATGDLFPSGAQADLYFRWLTDRSSSVSAVTRQKPKYRGVAAFPFVVVPRVNPMLTFDLALWIDRYIQDLNLRAKTLPFILPSVESLFRLDFGMFRSSIASEVFPALNNWTWARHEAWFSFYYYI